MKTSLEDYLEDIRTDLIYWPSVYYTWNKDEDVGDLRWKFADNLYDIVDQLIWKYEESFRMGK